MKKKQYSILDCYPPVLIDALKSWQEFFSESKNRAKEYGKEKDIMVIRRDCRAAYISGYTKGCYDTSIVVVHDSMKEVKKGLKELEKINKKNENNSRFYNILHRVTNKKGF